MKRTLLALAALLACYLPADAQHGGDRTLTVTKSGVGAGTVSGPGIDCGADCSEVYANNTQVTLTATPTAGSQFDGWAGACTGTGACVVTMNANKTVDAAFSLIPTYTLTLLTAGDGSGTVNAVPAGPNPAGASVVLTATPDAGSTFAGWAEAPCAAEFLMPAANLTCTATFDETPPPPFVPNIVLENVFLIDYVNKGNGVWNTQPAGFVAFVGDHPFPRSFADPDPSKRFTTEGVPFDLPDADQVARGVYGTKALAEYGIMMYVCNFNAPGVTGCGANDPDVHRFIWTGPCPPGQGMCRPDNSLPESVDNPMLINAHVRITHELVSGGLYRLRIGVHGLEPEEVAVANPPIPPGLLGSEGAVPGVGDARRTFRSDVHDGLTHGFKHCDAAGAPCGPQYSGGLSPMFVEGHVVFFHVADTKLVPAGYPGAGMTVAERMNALNLAGQFGPPLVHVHSQPCVVVRATAAGAPQIMNCTD